MFDRTSRYYSIETATMELAGGRRIRYKRRRFLPQAEDMQLLVEVPVTASDRLDLIAFRTLGEPDQYWRICDANNAMNPDSLLDPGGAPVRVPIPTGDGNE